MKFSPYLLAFALLAPACKQTETADAQAAPATSADSLQFDTRSPQLNFIKVETVAESQGGPSARLTGIVAFDEDHTQRLASPIDGRVTKVLVRPGDQVKVSQSLVELSSAHVGELQSNAQKAQQDLSVAQKELDRAHKLQEDGAISEKEVAVVEADYRKAKSDVGSTAAQLRALGISASDPAVLVSLRSQVVGTVVERNVLVGQEVRADGAAPLLTITDLSTVWVLADLYEQDLKLVQQGMSVEVHVPAFPDDEFSGKIAHIGDEVDPGSRTVKVRCIVPNLDGRLKPEMFARVDLSGVVGAPVIAISSKAVLSDSEHSRVLVDVGGGVYKARVVNVGPETDGRVRVLSGLVPGERVVTDGAIFLRTEMDSQ